MIIFVRHGQRADQSAKEAKLVETYFDPHLTAKGVDQAEVTGLYL